MAGDRPRRKRNPFPAHYRLYYYRARHYSPEQKRFIQRDPLAYSTNANLFAYVGQCPTILVDPQGEESTAYMDAGGYGSHANPGSAAQLEKRAEAEAAEANDHMLQARYWEKQAEKFAKDLETLENARVKYEKKAKEAKERGDKEAELKAAAIELALLRKQKEWADAADQTVEAYIAHAILQLVHAASSREFAKMAERKRKEEELSQCWGYQHGGGKPGAAAFEFAGSTYLTVFVQPRCLGSVLKSDTGRSLPVWNIIP